MLSLRDLLRVSARQALRQRGRYLGVVLAIMLGTMGFVVIVTMGRDVKKNLNKDLDLLGGATLIKAYFSDALADNLPVPFSDATVAELKALPGVVDVSLSAFKADPAFSQRNQHGRSFQLIAVDDSFWRVNSFLPVSGEFFTAQDCRNRERVCVLGAKLAEELFRDEAPVGQVLPIDGDLYRVVGVLDGLGVGDRADFAFVPLTTARDRVARLSPPCRAYVRCHTWDDVERVAQMIPSAVGKHQDAGNLRVDVAVIQLRHIRRIVRWVQLFIAFSFGATTLLGGFGMWNGMMAAVKARTREIGLKKAMGAEDSDILLQFLTESLCLSLGSAALGVVAGRVVIQAIARLLNSTPPEQMFLISLAVSVVIAVLIGVGAGFYPSLRASRMEVVSAVRYE